MGIAFLLFVLPSRKPSCFCCDSKVFFVYNCFLVFVYSSSFIYELLFKKQRHFREAVFTKKESNANTSIFNFVEVCLIYWNISLEFLIFSFLIFCCSLETFLVTGKNHYLYFDKARKIRECTCSIFFFKTPFLFTPAYFQSGLQPLLKHNTGLSNHKFPIGPCVETAMQCGSLLVHPSFYQTYITDTIPLNHNITSKWSQLVVNNILCS